MSTFFISDLHLCPEVPTITELFLKFLTEITEPKNTLFILGDFFESWVGDDDLTDYNLTIINALRTAVNQGLKIFFMHGNRDFLLGSKFFKLSGCKKIADPFVWQHNQHKILLMHGDSLCTDDQAYQRFRKKSRNFLVQKIFLLQSLKKRKAIAERYRVQSKEYTAKADEKIMDVNQDAVITAMTKHHTHYLIHGHTHKPAKHEFENKGNSYTRWVLGAWHEQGNVLIFANDEFEYLVFN